ncbi:hypothetical protein SAMN05216480_1197 [Pustulibacterium marinum]|uniref:Beta-galactosidase trimerisation domain-containing protein n=1 Tax=Pustulibacterium marinum TaxID=1224947 RepID=A0A1I7IPK2_9FLAO|nr:hypothetical protein [Pustulibacterium marinum]SFU74869.1 hypothetical protein SAMN05216480_1197 [Pustulibacterium marinum]
MTTQRYTLLSLFGFLSMLGNAQQDTLQTPEKTAFQTVSPWMPEIDVQSDIAIIYGAHDTEELSFQNRLQSWRNHGYETQFMTGISWGDYKDYYLGDWDGENHLNIAQVQQDGEDIMHGPVNPYVVPVPSFLKYLKEEVVKKAIDNGITTIYLEEPEFWNYAGYSDPFKKEWQAYYGFPWRAQHTSPENTYLSNKLKYHLFYNAIKEVSEYAKAYGKSKGKDIKVFIPTHSLINYTAWQIVSPEASLASLPSIDGYIAQVWTGTSRSPNYFNGTKKERVFENAFLEYNAMVSMTEPTKRKVYLLTDPIEDGIKDWADYKRNYEATFTAELLYPTITNFEVMPWPQRIYMRPYKTSEDGAEALIPDFYATQMQVMINSLNSMPYANNKVNGSKGIGVLMANSMMFQRFPNHEGYDDPLISNFYGQTMPLLKRGVPIDIVHIENLSYPATLANIKVLVMSYANMKPLSKESHAYLADWVQQGGVLVYCGADNDPYQTVQEWWNTDGNQYQAPSEHLFELLGITVSNQDATFSVGKGTVHVLRTNPKEFVLQSKGDTDYISTITKAYETNAQAGKLIFKNHLHLERGAYDIAAVLTESVSDEPLVIDGPVIDLYDPELPVLAKKVIVPGTQAFLYNLNRVEKDTPKVVAAAARVSEEHYGKRSYDFTVKSPKRTVNVMRVWLPKRYKGITVTNVEGTTMTPEELEWDKSSSTVLLKFPNAPAGVQVHINW